MDPMSLAALAAPVLVKGAEAFSNAVGEKLGGKIGDLCQTVINKFEGDSYAEQTLARAQEKPAAEVRQSVLKEVLAEKIEGDPVFTEKMQRLVDELEKGGARAVFDQSGQTVHGSQTNIAGNVSGSVLSGTFSGPVNTDKST